MLVLLAVAAVAVAGAVVVVATGRGGELVFFAPGGPLPDLPPDRPLDAADLLGMRLPRGLAGYRTHHVDRLLQLVAYALADRDARVAVLEHRLANLNAHEQARARAGQAAARDADHSAEETW